jgi:tyrosyl-tRNA synthetase
VDINKQLEIIKRGAKEIVTVEDLRAALDKSVKTNKPLKVKFGCDPSAPDIHLGHVVILRKLRQFQELGHTVQFLIGDFTARIGDPSGRSITRPPLSEEQVRQNAKTYQDQVFRVLIPERTEVVFNNDWLGKLTPHEIVKLCASHTVARMLERDDFSKRFRENIPIRIHEFLYPLFQGYDSVAIESDIELGGSDQLFNILVGRELQKDAGQTPQVALTMPIIEGLDGIQKMSKSLGNYVGVTDLPNEMFGKLMSIPDTLIPRYMLLLTDIPEDEIHGVAIEIFWGTENPRNFKVRLAKEIVTFFHSAEAAAAAENEFNRIFAQKQIPTDIETVILDSGEMAIVDLVLKSGLVPSKAEARRMIRQNAVELGGAIVKDEMATVTIAPGAVLKVGKRRFVRLDIKK